MKSVIAALILLTIAPFSFAEEALRTISISATGRVATVPDMAFINVGVETVDNTAERALDANSDRMAGLFSALAEEGIASKDIQTSNIGLYPRFDQNRNDGLPRITGYVATNTLDITIRDATGLGRVLDLITREGANRIQGIRFDTSLRDALMDDARVTAVLIAQDRAALYAEAAGVELGEVLSISEPGAPVMGPSPMAMERAQSAVPISQGELDIAATVHMIFAISGGDARNP